MTRRPHERRPPVVDARTPCRPPAVPAGARRASRRRSGRWFEAQGFVEVETGVPAGLARQRDASARLRDRADRPRPGSRRAALSAHLARVRLQEAAGRRRGEASSRSRRCSAIASAARCTHPEFTMLEWYRAGAPYERLMEDCARDAEARRRDGGQPAFVSWRGGTADPRAAPERLTVAEAFARYAGIDLLGDARRRRRRPRRARRARPQRAGIARRAPTTPGPTSSRKLLTERIEPQLGNGRATLLTEYPGQRGRARRGPGRTIRASPSASSSTAAASSWPTASAS